MIDKRLMTTGRPKPAMTDAEKRPPVPRAGSLDAAKWPSLIGSERRFK